MIRAGVVGIGVIGAGVVAIGGCTPARAPHAAVELSAGPTTAGLRSFDHLRGVALIDWPAVARVERSRIDGRPRAASPNVLVLEADDDAPAALRDTPATLRDGAAALPAFMEFCLLRYREAYAPGGPLLPSPGDRLEVTVAWSNADWERAAAGEIGHRAAAAVAAGLGDGPARIGISAAGRAVLLAAPDDPREALLRNAAHEGWHQYAQLTFGEQLPVWLDEAIACRFEALAADASPSPDWSRSPRLAQLRAAVATAALPASSGAASTDDERVAEREHPSVGLHAAALVRLMTADADGRRGPAYTIDDYARLWAVGLMLDEPDLRPGTRLLLIDAARGELPPTPQLTAAYWSLSPDRFAARYAAFVDALLR